MRPTRPYFGPGRAALLCLACVAGTPASSHAQVEVAEATVGQLQAALGEGRTTAVQLVRDYLHRIVAYDRAGPSLNSVVTINPSALEEAAALDEERRLYGPRGPLHGIPVVVKDNIDVAGMPTTGGTLALIRNVAARDADIVARLRAAGAVILAKTNMHELASGATTISSIAGQTHNPYDPERAPGGSSGGTAVAVASSFATLGWGTDTCGSIRSPAALNGLFALRPTLGRTDMTGILPLAGSHDVVAPVARTVPDLALALDVTVGAARPGPFTAALDAAALEGLRIGVLEEFFHGTEEDIENQWVTESLLDRLLRAGEGVTTLDLSVVAGPPDGYQWHPDEIEPSRLTHEALTRVAALGSDTATVTLPNLATLVRETSLVEFEFRNDFNAYLAGSPNAPVRSLAELLEGGLVHPSLDPVLRTRRVPEPEENQAYLAALARRDRLRAVLDSVFDAFDLDVLAYPAVRRIPAPIGDLQLGSTCGLSSNSGWPAISIPVGLSEEGLPVGMELLAREGDDEALVAVAYAFERATNLRVPPQTTPALENLVMPTPRVVELVAPSNEEGDFDVEADFVLNAALSRLEYEVRWTPTGRDAVVDVVLRVPRADGRFRVVHLLNETDADEAVGVLTLSPALRRLLEAGEMRMYVITERTPSGRLVGSLRIRDRGR